MCEVDLRVGGAYRFSLIADLEAKAVRFKSDVISPVCQMAVCLDSEGNSPLPHQLKSGQATILFE